LTRQVAREAVFHSEFREDLRYWVQTDRAVALRVFDLIEAVLRDPFQGIGKPEPLKHVLAGAWPRRITQEHRLVYRVTDKRMTSFSRGITTDLLARLDTEHGG
jgi:toxin YoeB